MQICRMGWNKWYNFLSMIYDFLTFTDILLHKKISSRRSNLPIIAAYCSCYPVDIFRQGCEQTGNMWWRRELRHPLASHQLVQIVWALNNRSGKDEWLSSKCQFFRGSCSCSYTFLLLKQLFWMKKNRFRYMNITIVVSRCRLWRINWSKSWKLKENSADSLRLTNVPIGVSWSFHFVVSAWKRQFSVLGKYCTFLSLSAL